MGGDHSTKFGVRWRSTPYQTISQTGGGATARIRSSGINEVDITRDGDTNREMWRILGVLQRLGLQGETGDAHVGPAVGSPG